MDDMISAAHAAPWKLAVPCAVALYARRKRWLTPVAGTLAGLAVGCCVVLSGWDTSLALLVYFASASISTKIARRWRGGDAATKDADHKRGRDGMQVAAVGAVPALLCACYGCSAPAAGGAAGASRPGLLSPLSPGGDAWLRDNNNWRFAYLAWLACCCGDTLASELGALAPRGPLLVTTLRPVPRGTDGGVTYEGTLWSALGGVLVWAAAALAGGGAVAGFGSHALMGCMTFAVLGTLGSLFDSVLGALLQPRGGAGGAGGPRWKALNTAVNFLSSGLTVGLAALIERHPQLVLPPCGLLCVILVLLLSPLSPFVARKGLHVATSALVVAFARTNNTVLVVALAATVLLAHVSPVRGLFGRFDERVGSVHSVKRTSPGIPMYSAAILLTFVAVADGPARLFVLGPMFFADPAGALVGRCLQTLRRGGGGKAKDKDSDDEGDDEAGSDADSGARPRGKRPLPKTLEGSAALFAAAAACMAGAGAGGLGALAVPLPHALALAGVMALLELVSGNCDNLVLPLVGATYLAAAGDVAGATTLAVLLAAALASFVGAQWRTHGARVRAFVSAYVRFTRPHTVVGTTLSIAVNSWVALRSSHAEGPGGGAGFGGAAFRAGAIALVAALNMNVYIVGLNQMFDIAIDKINKPYLPVASGEFSVRFGWSLVCLHGAASLLLGHAFGSPPLMATLVGSGLLGTAYSIDLPLLRWKQFPALAGMCIFVVRGVIVQIGFHEHLRATLDPSAGIPAWHAVPTVFFSVVFFSFFGVCIALFKDIPDTEGDREEDVRTLAVRLGRRNVLRVCAVTLLAAYAFGAASCARKGAHGAAAAHVAVAFALGRKMWRVDLDEVRGSSRSIWSAYMFLWKCFYLEYLLLPMVVAGI